MAQPYHLKGGADSQLPREPGYKPHAGPRFVDLSVFLTEEGPNPQQKGRVSKLGADFWEVDLDSNFSVFGVRQLTEWPGPLH